MHGIKTRPTITYRRYIRSFVTVHTDITPTYRDAISWGQAVLCSCTVLPPGEFDCMILKPLAAYYESFTMNSFSYRYKHCNKHRNVNFFHQKVARFAIQQYTYNLILHYTGIYEVRLTHSSYRTKTRSSLSISVFVGLKDYKTAHHYLAHAAQRMHERRSL